MRVRTNPGSDGNLVASPFGRVEDVLPLSAEGVQTLQSKQEWWSTETVSGEKMLIYSRPVIVKDQVVYIVQVALPLTERDRTLQSLATTSCSRSGCCCYRFWHWLDCLRDYVASYPPHHQTAQEIGDERDLRGVWITPATR